MSQAHYDIPSQYTIPHGRGPHDRGHPPLPADMGRARSLPEDMYRRRQWVAWRYLPPKKAGDKPPKVPYTPGTRREAKTNNKATWGTYADACADVAARRADGIGFVLSADDPFFCIDLDDVRDPETGAIDPWAQEIIDRFGTYVEPSPSGTGIHFVGYGKKPGTNCKHGTQIECYDHLRFLTITEQGTAPVRDCQDVLNAWYADTWPTKQATPRPASVPLCDMATEAIIKKASTAKNGAKFRALYSGDTSDYGNDHSRADAALIGSLLFWTQDPEQLIEIWRSSGLYREKTEREDYVRNTIAKTIDSYSGPYYDPNYRSTPAPAAPVKPEPTPDMFDEMSREELIAAARTLQAERDFERSVNYSIETIARTSNFQTGPRMTAIGEVLHIADYQRRGIAPDEHGYLSTASQIATRVGCVPKTASGHLNMLNNKAGIGRKVITKVTDVEAVDMETGEIVRAGTPRQYGYVKADNVIDFAERIAGYVRLPDDKKHGGEGKVCSKHPNAGTYTEHIERCRECHDIVKQTTTKTSGPPIGTVSAPVTHHGYTVPETPSADPITHHGYTGGEAPDKHMRGEEPGDPYTQVGHTESVSIYLPKLGRREQQPIPEPVRPDQANICHNCDAPLLPTNRTRECPACAAEYERRNNERWRMRA